MKIYQEAEKFINESFYKGTFDNRSRLNIENIVHEKLIADNKVKDPEYYGHREGVVHSSSLYACLRGTLHSMLGTPAEKEPEAQKLGIFKAGNLFEDFVVEALGKRVVHAQREYSYKYKNITLVGRSDYTLDDEGIMRVGENKSVHSDSFWHRHREGTLVAWHNQIQLQIYMWLERELFNNPWEGIFSYISKDDCTIMSSPVKYNPAIIEEVVKPVLEIINERYTALKPLADERNNYYLAQTALQSRISGVGANSDDIKEAQEIADQILVLTEKINEGIRLAPAPDLAVWSESKSQFQKNWLCTYCDYHNACAGSGWVIEATNLVTQRNKEVRANGRTAKPVIGVE